MTTIPVINGAGVSQDVSVPDSLGRKAAVGSLPYVMSSEDLAAINAIATAAGNGLTNTQLRASPLSVTGTFFQATQPVSLATVPLPTGASTEATLSTLSGKLPTLGAKASSGSVSITPATDALFASSYPQSTTATFIAVSTNATGATFNAFGSLACKTLSVMNATGTPLEFRRGGAGDTFILPDGASYTFTGLTNASGMQVRRADVSNTPVSVKGEGLA